VTSETRRRGRGGRRSGRRRGRQRKNEIPGSETAADSDVVEKTNLRQAIEHQQRHRAAEPETTTTSGPGDDRQLARLPLPTTGNQASAAPPGDDDENDSDAEDDWNASGNESFDDEAAQPYNN